MIFFTNNWYDLTISKRNQSASQQIESQPYQWSLTPFPAHIPPPPWVGLCSTWSMCHICKSYHSLSQPWPHTTCAEQLKSEVAISLPPFPPLLASQNGSTTTTTTLPSLQHETDHFTPLCLPGFASQPSALFSLFAPTHALASPHIIWSCSLAPSLVWLFLVHIVSLFRARVCHHGQQCNGQKQIILPVDHECSFPLILVLFALPMQW